MSRYRITMSFDLEITDEAAAAAVATEVMRAIARRAEADGGAPITSGGQSPEVATFNLGQNMRSAASVLACRALEIGAQDGGFLLVDNYQVANEPLDQ